LSVVRGYIDLMDMDGHDDLTDILREYMTGIRGALDRADEILREFLSIEAFYERYSATHSGTVDLRQLVLEALSAFRDHIMTKDQTITQDIVDDGVAMVKADDAQLYEAVINLLGNAIKYTPASGNIHLTLTIDDERWVVFTVKDNGYGIMEDQQENLFEAFFRGKSPETASIGGSGLGLHLVKNIVERHRGEVIFQSTYRKGSTFGFRLPPMTE